MIFCRCSGWWLAGTWVGQGMCNRPNPFVINYFCLDIMNPLFLQHRRPVSLNCIAPDNDLGCKTTRLRPHSWHPGWSWASSPTLEWPSRYPSALWWGVVVWESNAMLNGPCGPKIVVPLRVGWISTIILNLRCPIVPCLMKGIACPPCVISGWNNLIPSPPSLASGRTLPSTQNG